MYDEYNTIENHQWIPKQAFLYFPNGDTKKKQEDDYKLIVGGEIKRLIYEGDIQYLEQEYQQINSFKKYLLQKNVVLGKQWSKAYVYKFLQSAGYDYKRAMKQILAHNEYKRDLRSKSFEQLRLRVEPFLKQGPLYLNGRDAKYRPIIVCDIAKIHQMKLKQQELYLCLQYFFQFLYRNMFIHGQVENVVGIIDVGGTSPLNLMGPMKMTIGFLQGNYKYKLHAVYITQSTGMFQMFYGIAKQFMKEDTIRKIAVLQKGTTIPELLQYANAMQVEQRFGGAHPNLQPGQFWPPKPFGDDYSHPSVQRNLITIQQYKKMYHDCLLPARKIYLEYIDDGNQSSIETPLLNTKRLSQSIVQVSSVIQVQKKQKTIFEKAMYSISCHSCFGQKPHRSSKRSHKNDKN